MSIYLDLAFFANFLFDAELIILAHLICSKKIRPNRVFFAALLGGMQGVLVFFPYFGILSLPPVSILMPAIMTAAAICPCRKKDFFAFYIIFLGSSFFLAGMITFIGAGFLWSSLLILPLFGIISKIKKEIFVKRSTVTLYLGGKKIERTALYDSGNAVFYLGKPVILANKRIIYEFLENEKNIFQIPYKSVGKSGTITGIRLDRAVVNGKSYDGAILGFFEENLSEDLILNGIMM